MLSFISCDVSTRHSFRRLFTFYTVMHKCLRKYEVGLLKHTILLLICNSGNIALFSVRSELVSGGGSWCPSNTMSPVISKDKYCDA